MHITEWTNDLAPCVKSTVFIWCLARMETELRAVDGSSDQFSYIVRMDSSSDLPHSNARPDFSFDVQRTAGAGPYVFYIGLNPINIGPNHPSKLRHIPGVIEAFLRVNSTGAFWRRWRFIAATFRRMLHVPSELSAERVPDQKRHDDDSDDHFHAASLSQNAHMLPYAVLFNGRPGTYKAAALLRLRFLRLCFELWVVGQFEISHKLTHYRRTLGSRRKY